MQRENKYGPVHDVDLQQAIRLGDITYLPHYLEEGLFVAPGGSEWLGSDLIKRGGKPVTMALWPRRYFKES